MAASGGRVGFSIRQHGVDRFQHAHQVLINVAIPKSKHFEIAACKVFISRFIFSPMSIVIVLTTIDFNDQSMLQTNEIDDEAMSRSLTAKMKSFGASSPKMIPDFDLLRGQCLA